MGFPIIDQTGAVVAPIEAPTAGQLWNAGLNKLFGGQEALYTEDCPERGADRYTLADSEPRGEELVIKHFECLECGYVFRTD